MALLEEVYKNGLQTSLPLPNDRKNTITFLKFPKFISDKSSGEFTSEEIDKIFESIHGKRLHDDDPIFRHSFQMKDYCSLIGAVTYDQTKIVEVKHIQIIKEYIRRCKHGIDIDGIVHASIKVLSYECFQVLIEVEQIRNILDWKAIVKSIVKVTDIKRFNILKLCFENRNVLEITTDFMIECIANVTSKEPAFIDLKEMVCDSIELTIGNETVVFSDLFKEKIGPDKLKSIINPIDNYLTSDSARKFAGSYIFNKLDISNSNVKEFSFLYDTLLKDNYLYFYRRVAIDTKDKDIIVSYLKLIGDSEITSTIFLMGVKCPSIVDICIDYAREYKIPIQWDYFISNRSLIYRY